MSLSGHSSIFFFDGQSLPDWHVVAFGNRTVGLGETVDVHGLEVDLCHLLKEIRCWWRCRDCDAHWVRQSFSFFSGAQESVDCWCGVEVRDVFGLE